MEQFLTVLSVVSTVCAIVFGYAAFARNRKNDTESEAKNDATVLTEIGYIKANTDEALLRDLIERYNILIS